MRKDAAAGVDAVTAVQYEADLEANLTGLLERFKSGRYRAPAERRVHLEKPGTSKTRPIGLPTLEDKILQRAVLMVLEPVYEQDSLDNSYGFRPGRGAHQALQVLWEGLMEFGGGWAALRRKLRGHYAHYGITCNAQALRRFRYEVERRWRKWLGRRSRSGRMSWERFARLLENYPLLPVRVVHSVYR